MYNNRHVSVSESAADL